MQFARQLTTTLHHVACVVKYVELLYVARMKFQQMNSMMVATHQTSINYIFLVVEIAGMIAACSLVSWSSILCQARLESGLFVEASNVLFALSQLVSFSN